MLHQRRLHLLFAALIGTAGSMAHAGIIILDLCPAGTTSNQNVYGTTLSGSVATWPASKSTYRDYQFNLQTASGTAVFDAFGVQLSASRNNQTAPDNTLRASLWAGPIVDNPILADALTTVTIPNSSIPTSGYASILLSGSPFSAQMIGTASSTFFFRVWAEGNGGSTGGYQTKMAALSSEMQSITMTENVPIDATIGIDTDNNGTIDTYDVISDVPEIDPAGFGSVAALLAGTVGMIERRRLRTRAARRESTMVLGPGARGEHSTGDARPCPTPT